MTQSPDITKIPSNRVFISYDWSDLAARQKTKLLLLRQKAKPPVAPPPDGLRTPAEASKCHPGISRLARLLGELLDASEHQPPPDGSDLLLKEFEALLGGKKVKPPDGLRKLRKPRQSSPDGLKTAAQATAKLNCSIKTLNGHIASGALRYVVIGHGTKRPRKMFTDADLDEFITAQTRKDVPCPSTRPADRCSGTTTSSAEVIGFTARRNARRAAKQKK